MFSLLLKELIFDFYLFVNKMFYKEVDSILSSIPLFYR